MFINEEAHACNTGTCEVMRVIRTALTRRGDGKEDPIRVITQYWDFEGNLLWEYDPWKKWEDVKG